MKREVLFIALAALLTSAQEPTYAGQGSEDMSIAAPLVSVESSPGPAIRSDVVPSSDGTTEYCLTGDTVKIAGVYPLGWDVNSSELVVNDRIVDYGDYAAEFEWSPPSAGAYTLRVDFVLGNDIRIRGSKIPGNTFNVVALSVMPVIANQFSHSPVNDFDFILTPVPGSPMVPAKVDVSIDDIEQFATVRGNSFDIKIAASTMMAGRHDLKADIYDASGGHIEYIDPGLDVPVRIALTAPASFIRATPSDRLPLSTALCPGFSPEKVDYILDYKGKPLVVASLDTPPYTVNVDLGALPSGSYHMHALGVGPISYKSDDSIVEYTNKVADDAAAAELAAKQAAEQQEEEAKQRADAEAKAQRQVVTDETAQAVKSGLISISNPQVSRHANQYLVDATVANKSTRPIDITAVTLQLAYDDYSDESLTCKDATSDDNNDSIPVLLPAGQSRLISFWNGPSPVAETNPSRKAVKLKLVNSELSLPLKP